MLNALLVCSLTMAAVTLVCLLLTPLLEKRYSSSALYGLWLVVLLGFLVPFRPQMPKTPAVTVEVPRTISQSIVPRAVRQTTVTAAPVQTAALEAQGFALPDITPMQVLLALYLAGAAVTLAVQGARHLRFMRTVRRWQRLVEDEDVLAAYDDAVREMHVRHAPALMSCAAVGSPMLVGLVRPRILLPDGTRANAALDLVLRHELTHHRRRDLPVKLLMLLARAMHWFNPAVYVAVRMADYACELSCDERAVRGVGRDERAAYSSAIIACLRGGSGARSALTTSFSADKRMMKRRLVSMMDMRLRKRGAAFALAAAALSVALGANLVLAEAKSGVSSGGAPSAESVEYVTYDEIRAAYAEDTVVSVYAFGSNDGWQMQRVDQDGDGAETKSGWDMEPIGDYAWRMSSAFDYGQSEEPIAVWITFPDGRTVIAAMNNVPREGDTIRDNDFDGHLCVVFPADAAQDAYAARCMEVLEEGWAQTCQLAGNASRWHGQTPMTEDEMRAVFAQSMQKMGTQAYWYSDADTFEAYTARIEREGGEVREDIVLSTLPGEDDMPYDEALEFAYTLIEEQFGTPRSELEQMGVYPWFYSYPYLTMEPEWEFYITPRRNCDIQMDHDYPDAGEYRVSFTARTQQTLLCLWYLKEEPEGELRWNESYRLEINPVRPEDELQLTDEEIGADDGEVYYYAGDGDAVYHLDQACPAAEGRTLVPLGMTQLEYLLLHSLSPCPVCAGSAGLSQEDYESLMALRYDGYEGMTVAAYQEKVWAQTDTEEYRAILERLGQDESLYALRDTDEAAAFLFCELEPLTAERWQTRSFDGWAQADFGGQSAALEYSLELTVLDADRLTVGEYRAAREGVAEEIQAFLSAQTKEALADGTGMEERIGREMQSIAQRWESDALQIRVEYAYRPIEESEDAEPEMAQEERQTPHGTQEDYQSLWTLMTEDYRQMSVADFNERLLEWANEDDERMQRIDEDSARGDYAVALSDEERAFVELTVYASGCENGRMVRSAYTGVPQEDVTYRSFDLSKETAENGQGAWCSLYGEFTYRIEDAQSLTVGQRDRSLSGMNEGILRFWEETELDALLSMDKAELVAALCAIAEENSGGGITIGVDMERISFESMDERGTEGERETADEREPADILSRDSAGVRTELAQVSLTEDGLSLSVTVDTALRVYVVAEEMTVNGERLISPKRNDLECAWVHPPLGGETGTAGFEVTASFDRNGFDMEDEAFQALVKRLREEGSAEVSVRLAMLTPAKDVLLIDREQENAAVWQAIDAAAAEGYTPVGDEPWEVLPASGWVSELLGEAFDPNQPVCLPLGDAQAYADYANMTVLDRFVLRTDVRME